MPSRATTIATGALLGAAALVAGIVAVSSQRTPGEQLVTADTPSGWSAPSETTRREPRVTTTTVLILDRSSTTAPPSAGGPNGDGSPASGPSTHSAGGGAASPRPVPGSGQPGARPASPVTTGPTGASADRGAAAGPASAGDDTGRPANTTTSSTTTTTGTTTTLPRTTTSISRRNGDRVGMVWMGLATSEPGPHAVRLSWGACSRNFSVTGGSAITYYFEKQKPEDYPIIVSADFPVTVTWGFDLPPGAVDGRPDWTCTSS